MSLFAAPLRLLACAILCLSLAACGGGGDGGCSTCALLALTPSAPASSPPPTEVPAAPTPSYVIGGTLSGLAENTKLVVLDNGGDPLTLAANGEFRFATPVVFNTPYAVTVGTHPLWQNCSVSNGSGTATADVSNVQVNCIEAQAQVSTLAGSTAAGSADGTGAAASFNGPQALKVDVSGNVFVLDTFNHMIRKVTPDGVVTIFAGSTQAGAADGTGTFAQFDAPDGVVLDDSGNLYVADLNHKIRKITPQGVVTTFAGSGTAGSADGTGITAQFNNPGGVAVDASGNLYVADISNHEIRKISPEGVVTTLAGSTTPGSVDGTGTAARFNQPVGVAVDASGNVYVTDWGNNRIRKITPTGVVTTFAGSGTQGASDGVGTSAQFRSPSGIAIDAIGNIYVSDAANHAIRKITPAGLVTTLAGSGTLGSADGIGTAAQFNTPYDVQLDASGNLYATSGNAIRKITPVR